MSAITRSSGNVFRDLGLPDPELLQAKADLAHKIAEIIERKKMTQREAASVLGVTQPKVSSLLNGRIEGFSMDRLVRFLAALNQEVRISVRPKSRRGISVRVA